jgi:hypothetical protein
MHREVGFPANDDSFDLADEEPLAPDVRERAILNAVAFRTDVDLLDREAPEVALQLLADPTGLD